MKKISSKITKVADNYSTVYEQLFQVDIEWRSQNDNMYIIVSHDTN